MKKIFLLAMTLLALQATPLAHAWSYNDGDLLLIFRESGYTNIEYDLGTVSNLLGHANGYTTTITGWNPSLLTANFGPDLTGVEVILAATTPVNSSTPTAWISSSDPNVYAYNVSSAWWTGDLHGTISAVGNRPINPFAVPAPSVTPTNAYAIKPSDPRFGGASYDYTVSGGTLENIDTWDGSAPFSTVTVGQIIPGTFDFWAIEPTSIYPNSPPDQLIGSFTITTSGALTFVAGPRPSTIAGINRTGNVSTIQFSTTVGNSYSVAYTNSLGAAAAGTWPVDPNTVVGNGGTGVINHTNSSVGIEFYKVIAH